jgi:hypothetical protein
MMNLRQTEQVSCGKSKPFGQFVASLDYSRIIGFIVGGATSASTPWSTLQTLHENRIILLLLFLCSIRRRFSAVLLLLLCFCFRRRRKKISVDLLHGAEPSLGTIVRRTEEKSAPFLWWPSLLLLFLIQQQQPPYGIAKPVAETPPGAVRQRRRVEVHAQPFALLPLERFHFVGSGN